MKGGKNVASQLLSKTCLTACYDCVVDFILLFLALCCKGLQLLVQYAALSCRCCSMCIVGCFVSVSRRIKWWWWKHEDRIVEAVCSKTVYSGVALHWKPGFNKPLSG